jgi:hypothetical protein
MRHGAGPWGFLGQFWAVVILMTEPAADVLRMLDVGGRARRRESSRRSSVEHGWRAHLEQGRIAEHS